MKIRMGIVARLTLVFVLFAAGLLTGVSILAYRSGRAALEQATISHLLSITAEGQAALDQWIDEKQIRLALLSADPEMAAFMEGHLSNPDSAQILAKQDSLVAYLNKWVGEEKDFLSLILLDPHTEQVVLTTDPNDASKFWENQPYFTFGSQEPDVQTFFFALDRKEPAMVAATSVRGSEGQVVGVLAGYLNLDAIDAILQHGSGISQTVDVFLVNTAHLFVTQPRFVSDPFVLQRGVHIEAVNRCLEGSSGVISAEDDGGIPAIISYRWLPERQLCLVVKRGLAEALAPTKAWMREILLINGLILLLAAGLAYGLARAITRPMLDMQAAAGRYASGCLTERLPESAGNELSEIAIVFNRMAEELQAGSASFEERLEERTKELSEREASLLAVFEHGPIDRSLTAPDGNIGERKQADEKLNRLMAELARSNVELERFAYVVSHDLQEPLRMVTSYLQLIERRYADKLDADGHEFIAYAMDGATRMKKLINDLLAYSRVGTRSALFVPVDCQAPLEKALANLEVAIRENNATIRIGSMPVVMADAVQLEQLFQNLIGNAIKFHGDRPPQVDIQAEQKTGEWQFCVRDNGIGIAAQDCERVFVIFQRLHSRDEYSGTGIGLTISKRIVEQHGGRIWIESQPGIGSNFFFTLPVISHPPVRGEKKDENGAAL